MGVPQAGWFIVDTIKNGWFGGTPILGNHHMGINIGDTIRDVIGIGEHTWNIPTIWPGFDGDATYWHDDSDWENDSFLAESFSLVN